MGFVGFIVEKKLIDEGIEPRKPLGKLTKKKVVKNRGMVNQKNLDQIEFNTSDGNNVKVQFQIRDGVGDVVFYVNDTLDDLGGREDGSVDPEILSGVLWVVDVYADRMKLNSLTFSAWAGKGDTKVVRGLDLEKPLEMAKKAVIGYMGKVKAYQPTIIPPTPSRIALAAKLGKTPTDVYDVDVGKVLGVLGKILEKLEEKSVMLVGDIRDFEELMWLEMGGKKLNERIPGANEVFDLLNKCKTALLSHGESGAVVTRNRRKDLYKRLMDRFFSVKWNINQNRDSFELTRKHVKESVDRKPAASYSVEKLMFAMFDSSFREYGQYYIPLFSHVIKKIFGDIQGYGWHVTSSANLEQLKHIQGTSKAISTMDKKDIPLVMDKGVTSNADVAVLVRGNVLLKYDINAWTVVDEDGNRWVPIVSHKTGKAIAPDVEALQGVYVRTLNELAKDLKVDSWATVHDRWGKLGDETRKKLMGRFVKAMEEFVLENANTIKNGIYNSIDVSQQAMDEVEVGFKEIVISDFEIVKVVPLSHFKEGRKFSDLMKDTLVEMPLRHNTDARPLVKGWDPNKWHDIRWENVIGQYGGLTFAQGRMPMGLFGLGILNEAGDGLLCAAKCAMQTIHTPEGPVKCPKYIEVATVAEGRGKGYAKALHDFGLKKWGAIVSDNGLFETSENSGDGMIGLWTNYLRSKYKTYVLDEETGKFAPWDGTIDNDENTVYVACTFDL